MCAQDIAIGMPQSSTPYFFLIYFPYMMAAPALRLPIHGPNQEYRCNKHKTPRYYQLEWKHLTMPVEDVKTAITSGLQYDLYGVVTHEHILSLKDAVLLPYNGLCWDKSSKTYFERSLYILVDAGVINNCTTSCQKIDLSIQLGGQYPSVESFRAGGLQFYSADDVALEDKQTVFDRVYRIQKDLQSWHREMFGKPVVKCV